MNSHLQGDAGAQPVDAMTALWHLVALRAELAGGKGGESEAYCLAILLSDNDPRHDIFSGYQD